MLKHKSNKINLYKNGIIKFIEINNKFNIKDISDIDYLVGILFLTEMNRYCKSNNISIHGYYISISLIKLFNLIISKSILAKNINELIFNISLNIDYLNTRLTNKYLKNKINQNLCKLLIEISPILNKIVDDIHIIDYKYTNLLTVSENINFTINKNINNNILSNFFYILLLIAKFMGTGIYSDNNLIKLGEYWSNIFNLYNKLKNIDTNYKDDREDDYYYNYINYKVKLNYSLIELKINSETIDEIINYFDSNITIK